MPSNLWVLANLKQYAGIEHPFYIDRLEVHIETLPESIKSIFFVDDAFYPGEQIHRSIKLFLESYNCKGRSYNIYIAAPYISSIARTRIQTTARDLNVKITIYDHAAGMNLRQPIVPGYQSGRCLFAFEHKIPDGDSIPGDSSDNLTQMFKSHVNKTRGESFPPYKIKLH